MYSDLSNGEKTKLTQFLIEVKALPCKGIMAMAELGIDEPLAFCSKGLSIENCKEDCPLYEPDTREEVVERVSWVIELQLKGLSVEEAIEIGMLKDGIGKKS